MPGINSIIGHCLLLLFLLSIAACKQKDAIGQQGTLHVAVAANVQFAMQEIEQLFESETGIPVESIISSSGKLTAQIMEGAPFDIFLSADMKYGNTLYDKKMAIHPPLVYAYGALVAWTVKEDKDLKNLSKLLTDAREIDKIAIANPVNAPYGKQAINFFEKLGILDQVASRLVYGESIAQTNQYIHTGATDIGFTAKSVVLSPEMSGKGRWITLDPMLYEPIAQGVVITRHGEEKQSEASLRFIDFLFSDPVRNIFLKYGYEVPDSKPVLPY